MMQVWVSRPTTTVEPLAAKKQKPKTRQVCIFEFHLLQRQFQINNTKTNTQKIPIRYLIQCMCSTFLSFKRSNKDICRTLQSFYPFLYAFIYTIIIIYEYVINGLLNLTSNFTNLLQTKWMRIINIAKQTQQIKNQRKRKREMAIIWKPK